MKTAIMIAVNAANPRVPRLRMSVVMAGARQTLFHRAPTGRDR
jgi:hypothetical protein